MSIVHPLRCPLTKHALVTLQIQNAVDIFQWKPAVSIGSYETSLMLAEDDIRNIGLDPPEVIPSTP